jgi:hypothetical protein
MTAFEIGYHEIIEDALWSLCIIPGMEALCQRLKNELIYYYKWRQQLSSEFV